MDVEGEDLLLLDRNRCLRCWLCVREIDGQGFFRADDCAMVCSGVGCEWSKCLECCRLTACTLR